MIRVVLTFSLLVLAYCETFKVCGAYCGQGWCNNKWIPEAQCDDDFPTLSCPDLCCRSHDICCGHETNITLCNTLIIDCLSNCNPFASSCKNDGVPVPTFVITDAMKIVKHWCCGSPCHGTNHEFR